MLTFQQAKVAIETFTHLQTDALHIYVGLAIFVGSYFWFGRGLRDWRPLVIVAVVAVSGEALDLRQQLKFSLPLAYGESVKDILNTVAVPVIIWITAGLSHERSTYSLP